MKNYLPIALILAMHSLLGQIEKPLQTTVKEVTVFTQGAQIKRAGSVSIPKGESIVKASRLSPYINGKSINVKGEGEFTILSVSHKLNYLEKTIKSKRIDSLNKLVEKLEVKISKVYNKLEVLAEKKSLLDVNKKLAGNNGLSISELKLAVDYYEDQISAIKKYDLENEQELKRLNEKKNSIISEIKTVSNLKSQPTSEVFIKVKSEKGVTGKFEITYPVKNAGWFPKYDIRVKDVQSKLKLEYKADVFQQTGVNWDNVKLKLSTADPNQSGVLPVLETWYLNFARNTIWKNRDYSQPSTLLYNENEYRTVRGKITDDIGEALPGVNVVVKGTTRGTTTDLDGNYELTVSGDEQLVFSYVGFDTQEVRVGQRSNVDISLGGVTELQEVVVTGSSRGVRLRGVSSFKQKAETITTSIVQNTTSFTFEINEPYSIKSTGEKLTVDLKQHEIATSYKYYSIPKLDPSAFLIAQLTEWNSYSLLEGEANLFFEGTFVGNTILDPKAFNDTLDVSLGRDKSIVIERKVIDEFNKKKFIGSNKIETRSFDIQVRNNKQQTIDLTIYDQIPVSAMSDISVNAEELSGGQLEEQTGKVTWSLLLDAGQQSSKTLTYEVKYPKREKIQLE